MGSCQGALNDVHVVENGVGAVRAGKNSEWTRVLVCFPLCKVTNLLLVQRQFNLFQRCVYRVYDILQHKHRILSKGGHAWQRFVALCSGF